MSVGLLQKVLQNLLSENISIRDLPLILEALSEGAPRTKNAGLLTEVARKALTRTISDQYKSTDSKITAVTFEPALEHYLISTVNQQADSLALSIPPEVATELTAKIADAWKSAMDRTFDNTIVLCNARIRSPLRNLISRAMPRLPVVAYDEITAGIDIEPVEVVSMSETLEMVAGQNLPIGVQV